MTNDDSAILQDEVQHALKRYHRAHELEDEAAGRWPAVAALVETGMTVAAAIRQVLMGAIADLESRRGADADLLRRHYLHGTSIKALADDYALDVSSLYKRRHALIAEIAPLIDERNRSMSRSTAARRFLPRQPVVGLESLVADLMAALRDPHAPLVLVIEGMGGLGKTTLAQLVAAEWATDPSVADVLWTSAKHTDFDIWAGMRRPRGPAGLQTADLIAALAHELGTVSTDLRAARDEVVARCRRSPYLIVVDNLETVEDMAALAPLAELLVGPSRLLITTRDRAVDVLPATMPRRYVPLHELDAPTSFALLRSAARHTGALSLAAANESDLQRIYAVTGGNPLALWLVAGQAVDMPWTTFVDDLVAQSPRLRSGYELYDYLYRRSWEQLSDDARLVLFAMHRCESGATYDLLHELSGLDERSFAQAIKDLRARMLLHFDGEYRIHRLTYAFLRVVIAGWWS